MACLAFLPLKGFSQQFLDNYQFLLKTNVLNVKNAQQWDIITEFKSNHKNQTNSFEIGRNKFIDGTSQRKSVYLTYRRVFYTNPVFKNNYLFVAPYGRIKYRDVYQKGIGSWFFEIPFRDFNSTSIITGLDVGQQTVIKRVTVGLSAGAGLGYVLKSKVTTYGVGTDFHLDGNLLIHVGYIFKSN